jgi:hypothetical protein
LFAGLSFKNININFQGLAKNKDFLSNFWNFNGKYLVMSGTQVTDQLG